MQMPGARTITIPVNPEVAGCVTPVARSAPHDFSSRSYLHRPGPFILLPSLLKLAGPTGKTSVAFAANDLRFPRNKSRRKIVVAKRHKNEVIVRQLTTDLSHRYLPERNPLTRSDRRRIKPRGRLGGGDEIFAESDIRMRIRGAGTGTSSASRRFPFCQ